MLFSSMIFLWLFLPIVLLVSRILPLKLNNIFLLTASLVFYAWGEPKYVLLMLFSILLNYCGGLLIGKYEDRRCLSKWIVGITVFLNLALLGYFKYAGYLVTTINRFMNDRFTIPVIALPIGISFFTFQALSYVVDVYRGECSVQKNPLHLALYISFFPQLIAGPIVKYKDVSEQIENRRVSREKMAEGIRRFVYGLAKKVLIANVLAEGADLIYALDLSEMSCALAWMASILYTFQIYYDFSGYSDMAIGLGKMFGFDFRENFQYPYLSCSIREFWKRWHISLGTWFKEYVYIPLGGNRKGKGRTYLNLWIVFFLTGMWHGAGTNFILWGLFHGFFSVLERFSFGTFLKKHKALGFVYAFLVVHFGWVLFRAERTTTAIGMAIRMLMPWKYPAVHYTVGEFVTPHMLVVLFAGVLGMGLLRPLFKRNNVTAVLETVACTLLLLLCIASLTSSTYNPFIYFRF